MSDLNNFLKKILSLIIRFFSLPFLLLGMLIPKDNKLWIFGSFRGVRDIDNSWYLFDFITKYVPEIRAIWLTREKKILKKIQNDGGCVYRSYSLKGVYYSLVAKVGIMSFSWIDLPLTFFLFSKRSYLIQLWHGTPLKSLEEVRGGKLIVRILRFIFVSYLGREYDYIISATENNTEIYSKIFDIDKKRVVILGQPRNDQLFRDYDVSFFRRNHLEGKKIFLYAPTWRKDHLDLFEDYYFDFLAMENFLKGSNSALLLKSHPGSKKLKTPEDGNNIITYEGDSYKIMNKVDVLLTDYSSIYFDFLLLNRPIIFTPFDLEKYIDSTSLYYEYNDVTPGIKARNWIEVISSLEKIIEGGDAYADRRNIINSKFNKFKDANNCQRVVDFIKQKIL